MFWVVQENIYNESGFGDLMRALDRFCVPHVVVKVVPFSYLESPRGKLEPEVDPQNPVMVFEAYTMGRLARARGWIPGVWMNENFDQSRWGWAGHLLNCDAVIATVADAVPMYEPFFVRPANDDKSFAGQLMDWDEFADWRGKIMSQPESERIGTLCPDTRIVIARPKVILREYRFFVVDGEVVTGSLYKIGDTVRSSPDVDPDIMRYARDRVDQWRPDRAFVLDVALTSDGPRVIEANCLNAAGFYACDVQKIVMAVEAMEGY